MSADSDAGAELDRHDPPLAVLDLVRDREDDGSNDAVVVNTPPVPASDWVIYTQDGEDVTVADTNPMYDDDAEIVVVAFREELEENRPAFTETGDALRLAEADDLNTYAFPSGRLRRVSTVSPSDGEEHNGNGLEADSDGRDTGPDTPRPDEGDETTLRDDLDTIAATVEGLNVDAVAVDTFREVVVVEKLGVEYEIDTDGRVGADDRVAEELEAAVEAVVDG